MTRDQRLASRRCRRRLSWQSHVVTRQGDGATSRHRSINAVAESFFATIKGEMIDHEDFQTRAEAVVAIADFIDGFYNVKRMHSSIGYMSPIEFELRLMSRQEAA
jgi:transposase InsO family protein